MTAIRRDTNRTHLVQTSQWDLKCSQVNLLSSVAACHPFYSLCKSAGHACTIHDMRSIRCTRAKEMRFGPNTNFREFLQALGQLVDHLQSARSVTVLTGAGISTGDSPECNQADRATTHLLCNRARDSLALTRLPLPDSAATSWPCDCNSLMY